MYIYKARTAQTEIIKNEKYLILRNNKNEETKIKDKNVYNSKMRACIFFRFLRCTFNISFHCML